MVKKQKVGSNKALERGPIVVINFKGTVVDKNKDEPQLYNLERKGLVEAEKCADDGAAEQILQKIYVTLFPDDTNRLQFLSKDCINKDDDLRKLYEKCAKTSKAWLDGKDDAERVFSEQQNEQFQMHLGGSNLILYPLMFAAEAISKRTEMTALPRADAEWEDQEIVTHHDDRVRLKLKLKADAWLQLQKDDDFKTPIFHFEHKTNNFDKALRKAILLSQLTWRRMFLACATCKKNIEYGSILKEANEKCQNLIVWFACLGARKFCIGALKGCYDSTKETVGSGDSYASFEYACTKRIDVSENGAIARQLMYALSRHLPCYADTLIQLIPQLCSDDFTKQQEYEGARAASKRGQNSGTGTANKRSKNSKNSGGNQNLPIGVSTGYIKKALAIELVNNDVTDVNHLWAIPNDAFWGKTTPFDGDHILQGAWNGSNDIFTKGAKVVLKVFSGEDQLEDYGNELDILKRIRKVPHVQTLLLGRKVGHIEFAVIVSPFKSTTSSYIGSLIGIQEVGRQILEVLKEFRALGIIHRDIKPSNILWSPTKKLATLIDFGLATRAAIERTSPKGVGNFPHLLSSSGNVGTEGYQAPEVLAGGSYNERVDIYSLGKSLQKIAATAGIQNNHYLDEAVCQMTKEEPSERCTAPEALCLEIFC